MTTLKSRSIPSSITWDINHKSCSNLIPEHDVETSLAEWLVTPLKKRGVFKRLLAALSKSHQGYRIPRESSQNDLRHRQNTPNTIFHRELQRLVHGP